MKKIILTAVIVMTCIFATFVMGKGLTFDELFDKVSHIDRFEFMDFFQRVSALR